MLKIFARSVLGFAVAALLAGPLLAAVTATAVYVQIPKLAVVQFLQGTDSAGTYKTLYTGGTNGSKVIGMWLSTNDGTATHLVTCQLVRSAVFYGGVAVTTVLSAGFTSGNPPINLMSPTAWTGLPLDSDGNPFFYLTGTGDTIQCTFATALTASTVINVQAVVADF